MIFLVIMVLRQTVPYCVYKCMYRSVGGFVSNLEQDSLRRVWCSTEGAGLIFGVAQREVLRSHWSSSCRSSSSVGPPTSIKHKGSVRTHTRIQYFIKKKKLLHTQCCLLHHVCLCFLTLSLPLLSFVSGVHRSGQVPHLDAAVAMTGEQIAPGSRPHPARALTLPYHEGRDCGPVH